MSKREKVYLVLRVGWTYNDEDFDPARSEDGEPQGEVVKAFRSREKAEEYRLLQEREAREGFNPFTYSQEGTEVGDHGVWALAQEAGLPLPVTWQQLAEWWDRSAATLPAEQKDRLWEGLYVVPFFEVIEMEVRR